MGAKTEPPKTNDKIGTFHLSTSVTTSSSKRNFDKTKTENDALDKNCTLKVKGKKNSHRNADQKERGRLC